MEDLLFVSENVVFGCVQLLMCVVRVKVIHMFEQFDLSDVVIALVKLAIGIAEYDDPNLVCSVSAHFHCKCCQSVSAVLKNAV